MMRMKRVIGHWTAGAYGAVPIEEDSYHFIILQDGRIHRGFHHVEDNIPPLEKGRYAAHTRNCNSYSIGVAIDAMHGARERPFYSGDYPITHIQVDSYIDKVARLCQQYDIKVTRETVLTHAEVEPTLGIEQKNKWDITWLPGMPTTNSPVYVGDILRERIEERLKTLKWDDGIGIPTAKLPKQSIWDTMTSWKEFFGGKF